MSTPRSMRARASPWNFTSFAGIFPSPAVLGGFLLRDGVLDDAHDVGFLHDDEVLAIELDLGARPLAEQHAVAGLDVERMQRAVLATRARADGDDCALHRFFLGGVGNDDAARRLLVLLDAADQDAILQWTKFHGWSPRTRIYARTWHSLIKSANAHFT